MKMPWTARKQAKEKAISPVPQGWSRVFEPFTGAWQRNIEYKRETVLAFHAVFACTTLIASDISKLRVKMVREDSNGIWNEVSITDRYSVLRRPNGYQNRIQFFENWITSKLTRGNAYILKVRSGGTITEMHVLNPDLVLPMVSDDGRVFYQIGQDNLAGVQVGSQVVPASEIIHDRFNCFYHPLVGLPPIYASGLAAYNGIKIQENSAKFFENMSRPSGILTAPGAIGDETANRLKADWDANYSATNIGKVAVLGDDLKYMPLTLTAEQSQMIEQLGMTAEIVCSTFHVPKYKVAGDPPSYNNIEALEQQYYSQCLQVLIESAELLLDESFSMNGSSGFEFDLDGLLRMDTKTRIETLGSAVKSGIMTPNAAMLQLNQPPVEGGNTVYLQQQYYSLEALAKRDAQENPFGTTPPDPTPPPAQNDNEPDESEQRLLDFGSMLVKKLGSL